jgi:membrane associated rhomboid family serine protease
MVLPLGDVERTRIVPVVTYALIAINIVVFLVQVDQGDSFTIAYAATPYEITHGVDLAGPISVDGSTSADEEGHSSANEIEQEAVGMPVWLTLLTSLFLHGSPLHLAGNMLYLWIFGDNVEEILGGLRYVLIYLMCGVVGTLCQIVAAPNSLIPTLGASGAIAGVMGMYLLWFPANRVRVLVFQFLTEMPAYIVIGLWIISQIVLGLNSVGHIGVRGGVAYLAHIGGAATGALFAWLYWTRMLAFRAREYDNAWFEQPEYRSHGRR